MIDIPQQQIPGVYHRRIGDITVTAISDGFLDGSMQVLRNISVEEATGILGAAFRPARRTSVNAFLIYSAGRLALVDTGSGTYLLPTAGKVMANIRAAGVDPAAIDTVILTHMHPDHSAGLADRNTWQPFYPNAELVMHEREPAHWFDDAMMAKGTDREKRDFFQAGREQVTPYKDRWRLFKGGEEVFPGVTAMHRPGHTPGHTTYMVSSGKEQLLIWADTVHVPEVQTARPEVCMDFDTDKALAEASRGKVFDMAATDRLLVTGMHLHFPGFAHLVRDGAGYRLIPEAWQHGL